METLAANGRRIATAIAVLCCIASIPGLAQLQFDSHYSAYFDPDDARLIAHQEVSDRYSRSDSAFVVLKSSDSFLDSDNFRLLEDLSTSLSAKPFVSNVVSIADLGIVGDTNSGAGYFFPTHSQLVNDGRAIGLLVSNDERIAGIEVQVQLENGGADAVLDSMLQIRETVAAAISGSDISAHYTGTVVLNEAYIRVVRHDLAQILPLLFSIVYLVVAGFLGSWRAAIVMIPIGILSVVVAAGFMGLLQHELAAIHAFVPVIIVSISVAGCIHITLTYLRRRAAGSTAIAAANEAVRTNFLPLSLAAGTTATGFLGLGLSPSPPVRVVGYSVSIGIVVAFLLCMTLLPRLLASVDPENAKATARFPQLRQLGVALDKKRLFVVVLFCALALPAAWFVTRNEISDNVLGYFLPSHAFNRDTQLVDDRLSGINEVVYSVESNTAYGVFQSDTVISIARFDDWLSEQPEVRRTVSIAKTPAIVEARLEGRLQQRLDFFRNRVEETRVPDLLLSRMVSNDYAASAIIAYLQPLNTNKLLQFDTRAQQWAVENLSDYIVQSAGPPLMFAELSEQNIRSMLTTLSVALALGAVVLGVALRSLRVAWVGILCNALPILLVFSVWALVVGEISIGAAIVLGMVLGILLDDTIFLLTNYRRAQREHITDPVSSSLQQIGPAIIITSAALVAGLLLGLISDFGPIWNMSVLSAAIIATALLVDLTLLPALLHFGERGRRAL